MSYLYIYIIMYADMYIATLVTSYIIVYFTPSLQKVANVSFPVVPMPVKLAILCNDKDYIASQYSASQVYLYK